MLCFFLAFIVYLAGDISVVIVFICLFYIFYLIFSIKVMSRFYKEELFWIIKSDRLHSNHLISTFIKSKPRLYTHGFLWETSWCEPKKLQRDIKEEFQYKYWVDVTNPTQLPADSEGVIVELDVQFADEETERLYRAHEQTIDLQLDGNNIVTFEKDQSFDFDYTNKQSKTMKKISFLIHLVFIVFGLAPMYHVITKVINWKTYKHFFFKHVYIKKIISSIEAPVHNITEETLNNGEDLTEKFKARDEDLTE